MPATVRTGTHLWVATDLSEVLVPGLNKWSGHADTALGCSAGSHLILLVVSESQAFSLSFNECWERAQVGDLPTQGSWLRAYLGSSVTQLFPHSPTACGALCQASTSTHWIFWLPNFMWLSARREQPRRPDMGHQYWVSASNFNCVWNSSSDVFQVQQVFDDRVSWFRIDKSIILFYKWLPFNILWDYFC